MPPKKKVTAKTATESQQPQQKITTQQQKPIVSTPAVQQQTAQKKSQAPKQKIKVQPKRQSQGQTDNNTGTISTTRPGLTEADILKMRRQKFRNAASAITEDVDDKTKEERMKKFGIQPKESKQQIEERKKKFSNPGTSILTEDEETLRQRRQKFTSNQIALDAPEVLEERKKKFARNEQTLLSLDDEIAKTKTKQIKKSKDRVLRKIQKGGREGKFRNKGRKHSTDKSDQKSRKQIFGKKKFIKRFKPNNRTHVKSNNS